MPTCTSTTTCTTTSPSPASNTPPSPQPPWSRESFRVGVQTLVDNGTIDITRRITQLDQTVAGSSPYAITLPNGTYKGQIKEIEIPSANLTATSSWLLSGTFAKYTSLTFDSLGFNAMLRFDGTGWQLIGGNCTPNA